MHNATFFHVDVFATQPLSGNGLAVFLDTDDWSASAMQRVTREMKQFESIFLSQISPSGAAARVFTVEEELPFAGHPVLGAAAVLHRALAPHAPSREWTLKLAHGPLAVRTEGRGSHWLAEMNQGQAIHGSTVSAAELQPILARLGLGGGLSVTIGMRGRFALQPEMLYGGGCELGRGRTRLSFETRYTLGLSHAAETAYGNDTRNGALLAMAGVAFHP